MSEFKLAATIEVDTKVARQIISQYFSVVPKVKEFLDTLGHTGKLRGYIKSAPPYSRIRWFPAWKSVNEKPGSSDAFKVLGEIERQSKNTPIQSTNADVIKDALRTLYRIINSDDRYKDVKIILSIYDEIRLEVPEEIAEEWRLITETTMIQCAAKVLTKVPIVADCTVTDAWEK